MFSLSSILSYNSKFNSIYSYGVENFIDIALEVQNILSCLDCNPENLMETEISLIQMKYSSLSGLD